MATLTRSSVQRWASAPTRVTPALVDELRMIVDSRGARSVPSLVADYVARYRLTHRDVEALVAALAQQEDPTNIRVPERAVQAAGTPPVCRSVAVIRSVQMTVSGAEPDDPIAGGDPGGPGEDVAWMFGQEPDPPVPRAADDIVGKALDDLMGDWVRTGGQLTRADVALLITKRKLSSAEHGSLLERLEEAGVDLPALADLRLERVAPEGYEHHEDSVGQYLRMINRHPLIGGVREVELWSVISQGAAAQEELDAAREGKLSPGVQLSLQTRVLAGRQAHAELVCTNLRLVVSIAKARQYQFCGVEFADRIQDGNLGLMRAADKFDGSKGFKFSTYATCWIKQAIDRGIADRGRTIRIPVHAHEQMQKVRKGAARLRARLDREPTLIEISEVAGLEPGKVQWALDVMRPFRSVDELLGDEGDLRLADILPRDEDRDGRTDPAEIVVYAMFHSDIARMLRRLLPERAARVVERRFGFETGDEETLEEIGADYGVTGERIRQIQATSMTKLQASEEAAALRSYLVDDSKAGWSGGSVERKAS
ncbi:hypothetical protein GCM10010124_36940 [Pilimelia terevasa]|uniref:RNA polymerase sigma-70 domain-containing protein n=1 Tax=Pilimelia terevasa TaxID=53372 RepID=A0A8J3BRM3_9ACTN|nr:RNA polymerase sigma factor RpoD/SigA [Pilimelia terevasa]GGK40709.1 hypothetical protein GCM10010124_36940 [Pilimelia terevasa]